MKTMYCYFGHLKSGSTWLTGIMDRVAAEMGRPNLYEQLGLKNTLEKVNSGRFHFLISQSTSYHHVEKIKVPYRAFHVIRDPRDITVSAYFSFKKTHAIGEWSQLQDFRNRLNQIDFDNGLFETMEFNTKIFRDMLEWDYTNPSIYEIKFEELVLNPTEKLEKIFSHLGILNHRGFGGKSIGFYNRAIKRLGLTGMILSQNHISSHSLNRIQGMWSFENLAKGRKRGQENTDSHYRKGIGGDWKNHFTDSHKNHFKEHFGKLLIELGYEKDNNW